LTYADNNATEFFKKQGFKEKGYMPEARWKGFIKDYNGSTMMQCQIVRDIDYVNISDTLRQQRDCIIAKINEMINKQVYAGLKWDHHDDKQEGFDFDEIQGLREAGWTKKSYELAK